MRSVKSKVVLQVSSQTDTKVRFKVESQVMIQVWSEVNEISLLSSQG